MPVRTFCILIIAIMASACASQPKPLQTIPDGARVDFEVVEPEHLGRPSASNAGSNAANMAGGTAAGMGMGAAYGAAAGLACGPMLIICSPAGAIAGAMGGGIFGLGFGTYHAAKLAIPADKADAMNTVVERTFSDFDFAAALDAEFRGRASGRWIYADDALVDVRISLVRIGLHKHENDHLSVSMVATLQVVDRSGDRERVEERMYATESLPKHVDTWTDGDGEEFRLAIEDGISRSVHNILWELSGY